jgi:hypothetical protein
MRFLKRELGEIRKLLVKIKYKFSKLIPKRRNIILASKQKKYFFGNCCSDVIKLQLLSLSKVPLRSVV